MSNDNDMNNDIDWSGVLRKEAIGSGGVDLGEVYGVGDAYIITQKGLSDKKMVSHTQKHRQKALMEMCYD